MPVISHELVYSSEWQNKDGHDEHSAAIPHDIIEDVARHTYTVSRGRSAPAPTPTAAPPLAQGFHPGPG